MEELIAGGTGHPYWQAVQDWLAAAYCPAPAEVVAAFAALEPARLELYIQAVPLQLVTGEWVGNRITDYARVGEGTNNPGITGRTHPFIWWLGRRAMPLIM